MANLTALAREVEDIVQDSPVTSDVATKINNGLRDVAGRVLLPGLSTVGTVETTENNYVALPDDFHRNLSEWAHSTTHNRRVPVYGSVPDLFRRFRQLDLAGSVVGIARQGRYIYYQRIPETAETIKIAYYKIPDTLIYDGTEPECLPAHLHEQLLVSYACWKYFERIEDGMDGNKPNTAMYKGNYMEALVELRAFVGPVFDVPVMPVDELHYDELLED